MTLKELKIKIKNNTYSDNNLIIFKCSDLNGRFIAEEYITSLANKKSLSKMSSNGLNLPSNAFLAGELYITRVDTFNEFKDDYSVYKNNIILCNNINNKLDVSSYVVTIPKIEEWQIEDYVKCKCRGLTEQDIKKLCISNNYNIYRIANELSKLEIFNRYDQGEILNLFNYKESCEVYDLIKYIILNDYTNLYNYYHILKSLDIFYLISLLNANYKDIYLARHKSCEELKMDSKKYKALNYYYKDCSDIYLINSINFLSSLDLKIKSGDLYLPNASLVDYIILKLFS